LWGIFTHLYLFFIATLQELAVKQQKQPKVAEM